ncbi:myosin light chain kinase, smooth muscle-like isoform X2 [Rhopilema esculentum]|uniref:myosin light chain kinase, smooth muscle-like isoform X2 n=1 Tax=Rhopilema esculentum TaxID=499914 RepID=UPI0031D36089|eukprot:gene13320-4166_t
MAGVDLEPLEEGDALLLPKPEEDAKIKTDSKIEDHYYILEELGKGKFGVVKKCQDKETGATYAAKYVKKTKQSKIDVTQEIMMMGKLHHKGLVRLINSFETPQFMLLVMELITGGELFEKVVEEDNLTERQVVRYLRQILYAVQHMHRYNMVHLDLKPENILCVGGDPPGYEKLKLIDFGMARILEKGKKEIAACGTAEFVAPEVLRLDPVTLAVDMWSLGSITYVLLSGLSPFLGDSDSETLMNVSNGEYDFDDGEGIFDQISDGAKQFIEQLLVMDVEKRNTVDDCLEHEWCKRAQEKKLKTDKLKKFIARRRWQRTTTALKAVQRLAHLNLHNSSSGKSNGLLSQLANARKNGSASSEESDDANAKSDKDINGNGASSGEEAPNSKTSNGSQDIEPKEKTSVKISINGSVKI